MIEGNLESNLGKSILINGEAKVISENTRSLDLELYLGISMALKLYLLKIDDK